MSNNLQRTRSWSWLVTVLVPLAKHATVFPSSSESSTTCTRLTTSTPPCSAANRDSLTATATILDSRRPSWVVDHQVTWAGGLALTASHVRVAVEPARRTAGVKRTRAALGPTTATPTNSPALLRTFEHPVNSNKRCWITSPQVTLR